MGNWLIKEMKIHPDFKVNGLKTWDTSDGGGYQGNLMYKGKKVAYFHQGGFGGEIEVRYESRESEKIVAEYCNSRGKVKSEYNEDLEFDFDDQWLVPEVVDRAELLSRIKRNCKKKTLIVMPDHKVGEWLEWRAPFSPEVKANILKQNPEYEKGVFANELI